MAARDETGLLGDLDAEQRAAVTTPSTLVAVIAAAGSGKTRVLSRRIAYRVATGTAEARHTLALTFTREAAGELRRRLRTGGLGEGIEAGTFHSVALAMLRQRWADESRPAPTVVGDRHRLLSTVAGRTAVDTVAAEGSWCAARGITPRQYVEAARLAHRRCGVPAAAVADMLTDYEALKRRRGVVDLDDLLLLLEHELSADTSFADVARWRFRHVLVDEAQDLNPVQYRFLRHLTDGRNDLFLVGDPAQAIYAFNGADPSLLLDVDHHLPGIEIVRLTTNRRCTPQIVAAGSHVLRASGFDSEVCSGRDDGMAVDTFAAADEQAEADLVAAIVAGLPAASVHSGSVAVLARTHEQLAGLRKAIEVAGILVQRRSLPAGSPLAAAVAAAAAMTSASQLRAWAHDILDIAPPAEAAHASPQHQADRRVAGAVLDFLREQPLGDGYSLRGWIATTDPFGDPDDSRGVELLTFHAAKGREWHTVIVTGVETGLVPHRCANTAEARAEEARLLHVAMTRASDRMVVTWAQRRRGYARKPSPYLSGLPTDAVPVVAPPAHPRRQTDVVALRTDSLQAWRRSTARANALLPHQVCSDADLAAIAAAAPESAEELSRLTGFGPVTAARIFQPIRAALDAVGAVADQS